MAEEKKTKKPLAEKSGFEILTDTLKEQAEVSKATKDSAQLQAGLAMAMADKSHNLQGDSLKAMQDLADQLAGNKFDDIEAQKEANKRAEETLKLLGEISENTEKSGDKLEGPGEVAAGIVGGIVVAIGAVLQGFILGIADAITLFVKGLGLALKKLVPKFVKTAFTNSITKPLAEFFKRFKASFTMGTKGLKTFKAGILMTTANFFGRVTKAFTLKKNIFMNATKGIRGGISSIMTRIGGVFKTIGGGIGKSVAFITGAFADAGKAFSDIGKQFGLVSKTAKTTADGAKTAGSVLSRLGSFFKTVFTAFQGVGRVLGRLFLPLTILLTAVDSIKGSIDGFTKQEGGFFRKLFAGVIGGLKGAVVGLIGIPLDLLKSAVGFIAGKLGFEGFQETLASFSIAGLIGSMFDKIKNTVLGFFDAMKDETGSFNFGRIIKVLVGTIFNTLTAPIRLLLEGLAKLAENIPLKGDDIAAGIRSFKGKLTMDTGVDEAIQNVENKTAASEQSENLNKASTELKSEERSAGVTIPDVINAVSSTNNSTRMGDNYVITTPPAADSISTGLTNR